ncbi:MAG: hypothetical protein JOZ81_26150 [Chloroflexi bacterium]|nr:hypothetical protein [Chloroflexota bacterium]
MGQHAIEQVLDPPRQVVERTRRGGPHQHIQADREDALVAPLQLGAQALGVLEGDVLLRIGDPLAAQRGQPRGLQPGHVGGQSTDHGGRVEWPHVDAEFNRQIALDERRQPAGDDRARVGSQGEHARVLPVEPQVVLAHLHRARCHQVRQGAAAQRQQVLVAGQAAPRLGAARLRRPHRGDRCRWAAWAVGADDQGGVIVDLALEALGTRLLGRPAAVGQLGVPQAAQASGQ